jgi:hypothetical protein
MEEPYIPFYKPYGMSDEEYAYEVRLAENRHDQWTEFNQLEIMKEEYEICVMCGKETKVLLSTHIDERHNYVEGAGQLCSQCYEEIYNPKEQ